MKEIEEAEKQIRKAQDLALLRFALAKEKEAQAAEEAKKHANRQAAKEYKKYLEEQMVRDAEDTAGLDEIRRKEEEKVWKARDDALNARQAARDYLMKMVDEGRQEQIRARYEAEVLPTIYYQAMIYTCAGVSKGRRECLEREIHQRSRGRD